MDRRQFLKTSSLALAALPVSACVARPFPVRSPYSSAIPERVSPRLTRWYPEELVPAAGTGSDIRRAIELEMAPPVGTMSRCPIRSRHTW